MILTQINYKFYLMLFVGLASCTQRIHISEHSKIKYHEICLNYQVLKNSVEHECIIGFSCDIMPRIDQDQPRSLQA